jgi:hypothetical protein
MRVLDLEVVGCESASQGEIESVKAPAANKPTLLVLSHCHQFCGSVSGVC